MSSNHGSPSDRSTTATTSAEESTKAGRGRGQRGVSGRGRQAGHTPTPYNRPSFIGREPTLKHDIFDYQETQQAQNIETTSKRSRYILEENTQNTLRNSSAL